ncbi:maltooligosyltrehalose trehalohydrolase [Larkinella arboricola]|uniref:Malto-oligosyltrehalose trehalohydrolase n=1 Tax=Larkinella arboricola TaxID=643671 RepID=A0A327WPB3_LARAB|nr:malto-oligosyltrehalose trehalohydrolase [Larkinella arboricola]RAJ92528.1 maltooligosyltrehalose trehalohydrolase [Larkinella arboricola]
MQTVDIHKRSLGVTFQDGMARVRVWAPEAESVAVTLENPSRTLPLEPQEYGYWALTTDQIKPGNLYKIRLNQEQSYPDPASIAQPQDVHSPSEAMCLNEFIWKDQDWTNVPLEEYLIYELHVGTFTPEGTFAALEEKLDYLKELGINAIEIMPVAQFPGGRNWGYDGVYPYAVQNTYGGARGLQHLVDACHRKGIAVVLDVVYNHMGPEGNYFSQFGPYFTAKYCTPWGNALNFDDAWSDGVRQYFIENALMWFRDFHIDALRMDAVHAIKDFSSKHILQQIREHVDQLQADTGRPYYLMVESDLNDPRFINPPNTGGYGMQAQWIDEFHHALRVTAGEEQRGYYSDFNGIVHLAKSYQDAYVYDGQFSNHRKRVFGLKAEANSGHQFIVFSQNHDQVGNRMLGERTSQLVSFEMQKLMAGAVLVSPYLPLLFMGEEWSEPNPFLYFISHTEEELVEAVRQGRKSEFADFHGQGEVPDPFADETFQRSKLQWELLRQDPHQTMFRYYQALIALRKQQPALRQLSRQHLEVTVQEDQQTLVLRRWHSDQQVVCLMNFSKQPQSVSVPASAEPWVKLLDSADPIWKGAGTAPEAASGGFVISLQPESLVIYTTTPAHPEQAGPRSDK